MIRLEAGPTKYLLLDHRTITRNTERARAGEPVAIVFPDGHVPITGHAIQVNGQVRLAYSQRTPLFRVRIAGRDETVYAAYATEGEVRIATEVGEDLDAEPTKAAPKATKKKAS